MRIFGRNLHKRTFAVAFNQLLSKMRSLIHNDVQSANWDFIISNKNKCSRQ